MSLIHEEQDLCQTIKAAEVVNVTNNTHYILNIKFNRQQNYHPYRKCRGCHWTNRKHFLRPRRSINIMKHNRSCGRGQPSTVENPLWRVGVLKNTKQKKLHISKTYLTRKLIEVTASRCPKLSTHVGGI